MSVGVMKDYKLKRRNLRVSHTLEWDTRHLHIVYEEFIINRESES
jgi:hypothetical protein